MLLSWTVNFANPFDLTEVGILCFYYCEKDITEEMDFNNTGLQPALNAANRHFATG